MSLLGLHSVSRDTAAPDGLETKVAELTAWQFRFDDEPEWHDISVPHGWDAPETRKDRSGPAWYRATFVAPRFAGRLWLRFGAVSYHCVISVNGMQLAQHTGAWDAFAVEISGAVLPGARAELLVRVEKPASLTCGPNSPALPGRFALRETLSGFLPYVWGHMFGGIWQPVTLATTGAAIAAQLRVRGTPEGQVQIELGLSQPAHWQLELVDPYGGLIATTNANEQPTPDALAQTIRLVIPGPRPWSPADPALYTARLRLGDDVYRVRFGLRALRVDGTTLLLNDAPIYPRLLLSWGWYPDQTTPDPGPERVRADFARLQALGYNGVKLCLWVPPPYYFDLADELGMLLWVELPMWLPHPGAFFNQQTPVEYERLVRQASAHPSVILYSLGCELNRAVGPEILGPLYALVKRYSGDALVRDNSGSGEAYGGLLNEHADYYDYHFYSELPLLRGLLDAFSPRWRPAQPWVFGEFCDYDTFRDLVRQAVKQTGNVHDSFAPPHPVSSASPWWMRDDPTINAQGARWQYDVPYQAARLRANGFEKRGAELERLSEQQGLLHRKYTLELVRAYREISGYVVTGEADTPITTAGMWDDTGRLKFAPHAFAPFNADLVVLLGWDKRRAWVAGGDRAAPWDVWNYPSGALIRPHLLVSHYGRARGPAHIAWSAALEEDAPFASGETTTSFDVVPGDVREAAIAEFSAPAIAAPRRITLRVAAQIGAERTENTWTLYVFPRDPWAALSDLTLIDPAGRLDEFAQLVPNVRRSLVVGHRSSVVLATAWTPDLAAFVERGGAAILCQAGKGPAGPLPTVERPFWREAVNIAEPHLAWGDFPRSKIGMQFFGCTPDHALDTSNADVQPILRRLDTRTMEVSDYAIELRWGAGRVIVSTLRVEGGLGEQPLGISRNTAAAYLLACWARYLHSCA